MYCPDCESKKTKVRDSRLMKYGTVKRRRVCLKCGCKFTTAEIYMSGFDIKDWLPRIYKWMKQTMRLQRAVRK